MAFWQRYPYTDDHQLNLDWVIAEIQKIRAASGITYDDAETELGADNVQAAIEKLNELIAQVAQMSSAFNLIDNTIAPARWISGHSYTHLQTVNDPTLVAIIDAVKSSKLIVLKIAGTDTNQYFYEESVKEIPGDYQHILGLYNPFTNTRLQLIINGLNDSQNVFCEILPEEVSTTVNSFNGRTGDVTPVSGDYAANDITVDVPDITATNVQDALVEIKGDIPATVVESFKGRSGAVTPTSGDYEARQVSYDNSVSHITASDVQTAIDTIVTLVLSSGVASFNGRVGAVIPTAGDYDATQIDYDNTTSGLAATTVQEAIDELAGGGLITVTLTLNGAKEDSITIYDSNNTQVGSCVFASGQTSGTCQIDVPVGGGSYKFASSVAKDTTLGTSDYEKTVTLTDDAAQSVDVFPDNTIYWYGNEVVAMTAVGMAVDSGGVATVPTVTANTNNKLIENTRGTGDFSGVYYAPYDLTGISNVKIKCSSTAGDYSYAQATIKTMSAVTGYINDVSIDTEYMVRRSQGIVTFNGIKTLLNTATGNNYVAITMLDQNTTNLTSVTMDALWLE